MKREFNDRAGNTIVQLDDNSLICAGCRVREGHEHRCFQNIELVDRMVNVFEVTCGLETSGGLPDLIFQGQLSQLNSDLLVKPCGCECQKRPTAQSLAKWAAAGHPNDFPFEY